MDRVTTFSAYNNVISNLMSAEVRQNQANIQMSSGKVADDLKGFGGNAEALTAAQTLKSRVAGFVDTAKSLSAQLNAQDLALTQVADSSQGARQTIANAVASGSADGLMTALQSYFGQAVAGLNTQYNGHYLFSGGKVNTQPVSATSMSDLITTPPVPPNPPNNPSPWTPDPATTFNNTFQNDQLAATSRLDESTTIQTGMLASNIGSGVFNAFAQVEAFQQSSGQPFSGKLTQSQTDFLTGMLHTFDAATQGMTNTVATNGLAQDRVAQSETTQQDRQTLLTTMVGGITDVDMAETASKLSQAQTALQASAQIFASLQNTTLLNYLK